MAVIKIAEAKLNNSNFERFILVSKSTYHKSLVRTVKKVVNTKVQNTDIIIIVLFSNAKKATIFKPG